MGKRIGIIADNHSGQADGSDVPAGVLEAFAGADVILHCGDAGSWGTLDRLATIAPVVAVRGGHNGASDDARVGGVTRVETVDGLRIGMVHDLVRHGAATATLPALIFTGAPREALRALFGGDVDVVAYAGTHDPRIASAGGILLVNPGSPTLPANRPTGALGHVAVLDLADGICSARIVDLAG